MLIHDPIYGDFLITDKLTIQLIKSPQMQRLKSISQYGLPDEYYHKKNFSRFDHSLGVYFLLRTFNASYNEQIAGLLHDMSHTAFSHLIDWVIGDPLQENFQDKQHTKILSDFRFNKLLQSYSVSSNVFTDHSSYRLLETLLPKLCADRIDYALRELGRTKAQNYIQHLTVYEKEFAFDTLKSGSAFAHDFLILQKEHYQGFEGMSRWKLFAEILRYAIKHNKLTKDDFNLKSEKVIISIIKNMKSKYVNKRLAIISRKSLSELPKTKRRYHKKFRYVDPVIVSEGGKRVSVLDPAFNKLYQKVYEENIRGTRVVKVI
jgi:hypothetical protein